MPGANFCPVCGWVENGQPVTDEHVLVRHPELGQLVEANRKAAPPVSRAGKPSGPRQHRGGLLAWLQAATIGLRLAFWSAFLLLSLLAAYVLVRAFA